MKRITTSKTKTIIASALLGLAVTGCAVGPDYVAPKPGLAAFHNTGAASKSQSRPGPSLDQWWRAFDDPMLIEVVQRALAQNLDLAASLARVQQARAAAAGAGADLLPTVDFDGSATAAHQSTRSPTGKLASSLPGYSRTSHEYTLGPAASWEIDLCGGLRRDATAAREEAQAAEADQAGVRVTVAADAADAYLQIRGYQARLGVAQDQIETDRRLLQLVHDRYNAGSATGREVAQADALLKQAITTVPPLRVGLEKQLNRLDVLMGVQPGTYAGELGTPHDVPAVPPIPSDNSPTDMLRRRPDIIAAERRLAASNEHIGAAISDYYPKISLSGALGLDSVGTSHMFSASAFQAVGGSALRWRLFDFGKVDAEVKQAKGANAEALAVYRQSVLHAAEDVENALVTLSQTQIRLAEIQDQIDALTKARDLSQQAYRAGSITLTDVLDADSQLLSARDALDSNRADAARAAVGVYRALGGGWEPDTHNLTASR
ncbi:TolC family protein [Burkholderia sp. Bp9140]|uniref:efflux transporter outer membrane subunit n=1 Tax=Burkholderia sp. Bp9140 TaxID=2184572 RepID=UPI000F564B9F|nr:efflux transporter outer membrane subunit [Burkholderia sp. Bp9140]RQR49336.1 TolC family protein [Burkholderia sp. Bp9140]